MNGLKNIRSGKRFAWIVVLSGAIVTTLSLSAFGQQEVDPTWYDPSTPKATVAHAAPAAAVQQHAAKAKHASSSKRVAKASGKRSTNQAKTS